MLYISVTESIAVRLTNIVLQSDVIFRLIYRNEIKQVKESIGDVLIAIQVSKPGQICVHF